MGSEIDVSQLDLTRLVTIAGAGFSKHASACMPLLSDLGTELALRIVGAPTHSRLSANERLTIDDGRVPFGSVELWMTALATRQPYHTKSEQLRRRSLFMEVAELVAEIVSEREHQALSTSDCPRWLKRLVALWHYTRGTVLTFNYDTLIEATVSSLELRGAHNAPPVGIRSATVDDVMRGYPPALPSKAAYWTDSSEVDSLRLIKLHGSLNWWGRPDSTDLFSVVNGETVGSWGTPTTHLPPMRGLSPVIVPPVADKSGQYGNGTVETLWLEAAQAIRDATCLVLFGYSMPPTDTTAAALVVENLATGVPVVIVDPRARAIAEQLHDWTGVSPITVGDPDLVEHGQRVDAMLVALEGAASHIPPHRFVGTTAGRTHQRCYVQIDTADGSLFAVRSVDGQVIVVDAPLVQGGHIAHPPAPTVHPDVLDSCRFVRLPGERVSPIYFVERTANTNDHATVVLHVGPA